MIVLPSSTTIPSWTVTGAAGVEVAWLRNMNDYVPNGATDGSHFLDLTGYHDRPDPNGHFGGVTQTFPTAAGFDYHVFLDIGVFISTSVPGRVCPDPSASSSAGVAPTEKIPVSRPAGRSMRRRRALSGTRANCHSMHGLRIRRSGSMVLSGNTILAWTRLWCSAWRHWAGIFSVPIGFSDSEPPNSRWDRSRSSGHRGDPRRRRSLHASNHGEIGGQKQTYLACVTPMPSTRFAPVKES